MTALRPAPGSPADAYDVRTARPRRRAGDDRPGLGARLTTLVDDRNAPAVGRLLLVAVGLVVGLGAPLLDLSEADWWLLGVISVVMVVTIVASARIDWARLPRRAALVHPALVAAALVALGMPGAGRFAPMTGVLVLCFAYIGLTQRPGTSLLALPPAAATFLVVWGELSTPVLVRLAIALMVWGLLGELLAQMTSRQDALNLALREAANSDALTGVANRRDWDVRIALAEPGDTVVLCDIDHFKRINDVRGHTAGDQVLADFGTVVRASLRDEDYCARYGGEEFVLLLPDTGTEDALLAVARLHRRWARFRPDVTFSAGLAMCRADRANHATLAAADAALYRAKNDGRNTDRVDAGVLAHRQVDHDAPAA